MLPFIVKRLLAYLMSHTSLIHALLDPSCYPHPVGQIQLLETLFSYIYLTGPYAYKLKKPLKRAFLDYSSLERRRICCEEEIRLNRRLAPRVYLEVVTIGGSHEAPVVGGGEEFVIEYAVKMVQFRPEDKFDQLLSRGVLQRIQIDDLAHQASSFHQSTPTLFARCPYATPAVVLKSVLENFRSLHGLAPQRPADRKRLYILETWSRRQHAKLTPLIAARRTQGFVRECHGDMRPGNITILDGVVTIFGGVEFNPYLRWIDTMNDIAFLLMELEAQGASGLASRLMDLYLEDTGDYAGLALLRFYQTYCALVRAKVTVNRWAQKKLEVAERTAMRARYRNYLDLALRYTRSLPRLLIIAHGPSGVGKTTLTNPLLERLGAIRIRSDVERKRLFGLAPLERSGSGQFTGIYTSEANQRTYQRIEDLAAKVLAAGFPVIVEATFLRRRARNAMRTLAERMKSVLIILDLRATPATLHARITERQRLGTDASEAGVEVLDHQLATAEPLAAEEMNAVMVVDTESSLNIDELATRLLAYYSSSDKASPSQKTTQHAIPTLSATSLGTHRVP